MKAAQLALKAETWDLPKPILVRMALHTGEAEEREKDCYGPAINRVARLLSTCHGRQTLLSLVSTELLRDTLPENVTLKDMGETRVWHQDNTTSESCEYRYLQYRSPIENRNSINELIYAGLSDTNVQSKLPSESSTLFFWEPKKDGGKWEAAESYNVESDDPKEIIDKCKDADTVIRNFKQESNTVSFTIVKWPADDRQTASD